MNVMTAWLDDFASAQRSPDEVQAWVTTTVDAVMDAVDLPGDLHELLRRAVAEHWFAFLAGVAVDDRGRDELVPAAHELAVQIARHHCDLAMLLKIYQTAQEASWDFAVDVVGRAPDDLDHEALLVWFWTKATRWFGSSVERSVAVFTEESDRIRRRGDTRRFELISDVLNGREVASADLSAELGGHPIVGVTHLAVIAHAIHPDSIDRLESVLAQLVLEIPGGRSAAVRPGGRELWGWLATAAKDPLGTSSAGERRIFGGATIDPADVRVTVGGPALGFDGFMSAHRDARAAGRVALAPRRMVAVTAYDDVAALTLLALDHEAAERFTRMTLGELAAPEHDQLRLTVRSVLTSPDNADVIAAALGVHKNTVRYRLHQAERLLGRPLAIRAGDLLLALDYYEAFLI